MKFLVSNLLFSFQKVSSVSSSSKVLKMYVIEKPKYSRKRHYRIRKKLFLEYVYSSSSCALQAMLPCLSCIFIKYLHYAAIPSEVDWGLPWRHTQSKHRDQFGCCPRLKCVPASKRPVVNLQKKKGGDNHQIDCLLTPSPSPNLWLSNIDCNRYIEEKENPEWHRPKWLFLTVAQRIERVYNDATLQ